MGLSSFVAKEPRALPVFILADISGSMQGEKINELNLALREMVSTFQNVDEIRGKFQLCIITFGSSAQVHLPLTDVEKINLVELSANGRTAMGAAFDIVHDMIEDPTIVSHRSYTPTIVLVSDGMPTDITQEIYNSRNYEEWEPLKRLQTGDRTRKCQRLALGIGTDADEKMLKSFVADPEIPVIKAKDVRAISKFFKWVTMSTVARMSSVNPDVVQPASIIFDFDDEDIVI